MAVMELQLYICENKSIKILFPILKKVSNGQFNQRTA
jgi:hypothetical protein